MTRYRIVKSVSASGDFGYRVEAHGLFGWYRLFRRLFWSEYEAERVIQSFAESGKVVKEMTL